MTHPADMRAYAAIASVRPVLVDLCPAAQAVPGLPQRTLLHAGPPYRPGQVPPAPVLNSAVVAMRFEGWAESRDDALSLLARGEVRLAPAQDHRCVVPLAAVLSPSQQVQCVRDAAGPGHATFAPLNGGSGPALRLGLPGDEEVAHLRWLNGHLADALRPGCRRQLPLLPLTDQALAAGDDCHGRTQAGTAALSQALAPQDPQAIAFLAASPSFFLNLWIAASKCLLSAAEHVSGSACITALGANGVEAGLQLAGRPGRWHQAPAAVPQGRLADEHANATALPAVGDSAVVEAFGLGAMAWVHAPAQVAALGAWLPEAPQALAARLLHGTHPGLPRSGARFGIDARRVLATGRPPVVALGMLDAAGRLGRIGGGVWSPPLDLFTEALAALDSPSSSTSPKENP